MQIHFRLPWIGDQLHQQTTRITYRTKIGASRYKVRVRFVWAPVLILVCRREVDHAHPPHPAVHHLHHGHGDPLRLLLCHQAAQGREGPRGRRWDISHSQFTPEPSNWRHLVKARLYLCQPLNIESRPKYKCQFEYLMQQSPRWLHGN